MNNHFQVLIIGGGNAGLATAAQLLRKNKALQIGIVEPSELHYYQPAWTLVGAGIYDVHKTIRQEQHLIPKQATWIKDAAQVFKPESNEVVCTSKKKYSYDVLIVCPGIQLDWGKIKGLKEAIGKNNVSSNYDVNTAPYTWEMIKNFRGGTAVFTNPSTPIKCGGAPHKIMYLAVDYWRKKGILDKCNVHYLSGANVIFGVKEYAATLEEVISRGKIHTTFGANVTEIDADARRVHFTVKDETGLEVNKTMHFELIHSVPPQSAPDFIKHSPLADSNNAYGYVNVDKNTLQHIHYSNVFSLGDVSNAPCSKTGAAIRKQTPVIVDNVLSFLENKKLGAKYNGYSACPIPTQYGKLMLAEFDYTNRPTMTFPFDQAKPRWSMWLLKTKILPWLYWNKILSGKA
jgi:sulfide:quinone oxidoreductase